MDGAAYEVDEVKPSEAPKSSDNRVSLIYKDDPEPCEVMSRLIMLDAKMFARNFTC
jgi:hypothetical protein